MSKSGSPRALVGRVAQTTQRIEYLPWGGPPTFIASGAVGIVRDYDGTVDKYYVDLPPLFNVIVAPNEFIERKDLAAREEES